MNSWNIPESLENEIRARDRNCVYCGVVMIQKLQPRSPRKSLATWEHIINDARIITRENIALCCCGCNASKGQKPLLDWLQSAYCAKNKIREESVAQVVKDALAVARRTADLTRSRQLSRDELASLANGLLDASDPAEKQKVRDEMTRGFYGH